MILRRNPVSGKGGGWGGDEDGEIVESVTAGRDNLGDTDPKPLVSETVVLLLIPDPGHTDLFVAALLNGFPNHGKAV